MPHDHIHDHDHDHGHDQAGLGHNHGHPDHLHSHMPDSDAAEDLQALATQFIAGFQDAADKTSYLRLTGIPFEIDGDDGPPLKLVDVALTTEWQVGTASPSFGSRELSYLALPGDLVAERTNVSLVYVSLTERRDIDLRHILANLGR